MEGEGALHRVEDREVTVEVGVKLVVARQDRGIGTVTARRKGHGVFLRLSRFGIDKQQGIAPAVVKEPQEYDVLSVAIYRGHRAPVVADGRGNAVVKEAITQVFPLRLRPHGCQQGHEHCEPHG